MSFAADVKTELCKAQPSKKCCTLAACFGILLYCNTFSTQQIRVVTENEAFAAVLPKLFYRAFGVDFDSLPEEQGKRCFSITAPAKLDAIFHNCGFDRKGQVTLHVNYGLLENECCRTAFLRGAFLAGGSVTAPEKRYHLELASTHIKVSAETLALLHEQGFSPKSTMRNGTSVIYFKQSDAIEDLLTFLGAPISAMHVMEAKVEKDLRNDVNRRVNCETANLTKVVDAAQEQLAAIRRLQAAGMLGKLPEKLQATAHLRRENPEATLSELAQMLHVSKSAINHRMRKLIELAR